jgi:hypothetical protein
LLGLHQAALDRLEGLTMYYGQIQFVKGKRVMFESCESDSATGLELTIFACVARMESIGYSALLVKRSMEKPVEHMVDEIDVMVASAE